jgi:nitrogen fixation-related uncharacterized protein
MMDKYFVTISIALVVTIVVVYLWKRAQFEPFGIEENIAHGILYRENPCGAYIDCRSCAAAAGCGWCADAERCAPMAPDGFPIRYRADTGALMPVCAPYGFIVDAPKCFD